MRYASLRFGYGAAVPVAISNAMPEEARSEMIPRRMRRRKLVARSIEVFMNHAPCCCVDSSSLLVRQASLLHFEVFDDESAFVICDSHITFVFESERIAVALVEPCAGDERAVLQ